MKDQKLLRFTELAAGVVSERSRLPLEPDTSTLEMKLYQEDEHEESSEDATKKQNFLTELLDAKGVLASGESSKSGGVIGSLQLSV